MRKTTLFISAVLTTFMLAVLAGVVSMNKKSSDVTAVVTEPAPTEVVVELPQPTPTVAAFITPEQAAALAAQVLGHDDVYSVETSVFNGESVYLVTFSSGDLVYVSPQGMIVSVTPAPVVVYSAPAASNEKNKHKRPPGGGGGGGEGEGEGEHEGEGD
jgi:hypothetical protein